MEKNDGFVLFETLIVSTLVLGTLIFLYIQLSSINRSYNTTFRYNTINGLYNAKTVSRYLENEGYADLKTQLNSSEYGYVDITSCIYVNGTLCSDIIEMNNISKVLFTGSDITLLQNNIDSINLNTDFKQYIKRMKTINNNGNNRLIVEYKDSTYASVSVGEDLTTKTAYTMTNIINNSSFEDNINNWSTSGSTIAFETTSNAKKSGSLSAQITTSSNNNNIVYQTVNLIANHVYYAAEQVYLYNNINSSNTVLFDVFNNTRYVNVDLNTVKNKKWTKLSATFTPTTSANYSFRAVDMSYANTLNIDNVLLIDLTASFGSGNEPDKDWCDNNINYFDTVATIYR